MVGFTYNCICRLCVPYKTGVIFTNIYESSKLHSGAFKVLRE